MNGYKLGVFSIGVLYLISPFLYNSVSTVEVILYTIVGVILVAAALILD